MTNIICIEINKRQDIIQYIILFFIFLKIVVQYYHNIRFLRLLLVHAIKFLNIYNIVQIVEQILESNN